ncbi:MAG: 50S ribosomal protein L11 [Candidatus Moranbacteria bacterium CG_4_8_14_3_um_filter_34_16]|nr:MAG: 50S ribosomal protein L11 [Candidatus Moranbacteria bacterium CG08_land_8_20_14_0_20_34_16]PIW95253.1 MAG: 50S ribosomal protein L11 [Candidatus Moranbacteria bacterium CG_4_8_14_3_um_filter_34_16]
MAKIKKIIKLQIQAGKATPAPPVGPVLGQHGLNIQDFCIKFNDATKDKGDDIIPAEITVFEDRTFIFILKTPPVSDLLRKALGIKKGAGNPLKDKVGKITQEQLTEIAQKKMPDLNANDLEGAKKIVAGTARSMGVKIE